MSPTRLRIATAGHAEPQISELLRDLLAYGWALAGVELAETDAEWLALLVTCTADAAEVEATLRTLNAIGFEARADQESDAQPLAGAA